MRALLFRYKIFGDDAGQSDADSPHKKLCGEPLRGDVSTEAPTTSPSPTTSTAASDFIEGGVVTPTVAAPTLLFSTDAAGLVGESVTTEKLPGEVTWDLTELEPKPTFWDWGSKFKLLMSVHACVRVGVPTHPHARNPKGIDQILGRLVASGGVGFRIRKKCLIECFAKFLPRDLVSSGLGINGLGFWD